jgi:hypothetical protein
MISGVLVVQVFTVWPTPYSSKDIHEHLKIAVESSDPFCPHAPQLKLGVPVLHYSSLRMGVGHRREGGGRDYARDTDRGG